MTIPLNSMVASSTQTLGGAVFEAIPTIQAQMKKPDINFKLKFEKNSIYFLWNHYGEQVDFLLLVRLARGMLMPSGGINSPVAGYLAWSVEWISRQSTLLCLIPRCLEKGPWFNTEVDTRIWGQYPIYRKYPLYRGPRESRPERQKLTLMTLTRRFDAHNRPINEVHDGLVIINGENLRDKWLAKP